MFFFNKIGHTGTLDPIAEGLLVLLVNKAVKLSSHLSQLDKEYISLIKLGIRTDTFDMDGKIIQTCNVPKLEESRLIKIITDFEGEYVQTIPAFSAKKFRGKHLYDYARKKIETQELKNKVRINKIDILNFRPPYLYLRLSVGSGTYIRAITEDIGKRIGCGAVMAKLRRIRAGKFFIKDSLKAEEIVGIFKDCENRELQTKLDSLNSFISLKRLADDYKKIYVKEQFIKVLDLNSPLYEDMIDTKFNTEAEFNKGEIINIKSEKTRKTYLHRAVTGFNLRELSTDNKKLSKFIAMF